MNADTISIAMLQLSPTDIQAESLELGLEACRFAKKLDADAAVLVIVNPISGCTRETAG